LAAFSIAAGSTGAGTLTVLIVHHSDPGSAPLQHYMLVLTTQPGYIRVPSSYSGSVCCYG
jgi:hypothetical protein